MVIVKDLGSKRKWEEHKQKILRGNKQISTFSMYLSKIRKGCKSFI